MVINAGINFGAVVNVFYGVDYIDESLLYNKFTI